jgi:hypothetical protein
MSTIDLDDGEHSFRDSHLDGITVILKIKLTAAPTLPQPFTKRTFIPEGVEATMELNADGEWYARRLRFFGWVQKNNGERSKIFVNDATWTYTCGSYGFSDAPAPEYVLAVADHCLTRIDQVLA